MWAVRTQGGEVRVEPGEPTTTPDATLRTDPLTLNDVLADPRSLDAAVADRRAEVGGDVRALRAAARVGQLIEEPRRSGALP